jgi:hypothetical protein
VAYSQIGQQLNISGSVTSAGGDIVIDPPTDLSMSPSALIQTVGGNINLLASGNITLATVNAPSGAVSISTSGGQIGSATPGVNNVTAASLTLAAPGDVQLLYAAQSVDTSAVGGVLSLVNTLPASSPPEALAVIASSIQSVSTTSTTSVLTGSMSPETSVAASTAGDAAEKKEEGTSSVQTAVETVNVGGNVVQKPADEIVQGVQPAGRRLVCRR